MSRLCEGGTGTGTGGAIFMELIRYNQLTSCVRGTLMFYHGFYFVFKNPFFLYKFNSFLDGVVS